MSLPDQAMSLYWRLVSGAAPDHLAAVEKELADPATHPMTMKKRLAQQIVTLYHGAEAADRARLDFEKQFSRKEIPDDLEEFTLDGGRQAPPLIIDFAVASGIASSRSAARRLVEQGAVDLDGERISSWDAQVDPRKEHILRIGRKMKRYVPGPG